MPKLNANALPYAFGIRHILHKHVVQAQIACPSLINKRVSPHTFRHTTAMHLRSGNDVNMVSYWLGHADINTTHVYVEIDMEMKRRMLEKAHRLRSTVQLRGDSRASSTGSMA